MTISQAIGLSVIGVIAALGVLGMIMGLIRGVRRQGVRLISILLSAVGSFFLCKAAFPLVEKYFSGMTLTEALTKMGAVVEGNEFLNSISADALVNLLALPLALFVIPILFIPVFFIVSALMLIVHKIVCGILGFTRRNNNALTRVLGMLVGALQGVLVAALVLMPIVGILGTAEDAFASVSEDGSDEGAQALNQLYEDNIAGATDGIAVKAVDTCTSFMYRGLATVKVNGERVDMTKTSDNMVYMIVNAPGLMEIDWFHLADYDKQTLDSLAEVMTSDAYMCGVSADLLNSLGAAFTDGGLTLGMKEPFLSMLNSYMQVLKTTDGTTVRADMRTTLNVYYLLSDYNALDAISTGRVTVSAAFLAADSNGDSLFAKMTEELGKNPRMNDITVSINEFAIKMLLEKNGLDSDAAATLEGVKGGINEALALDKTSFATEDEYKAAVSDSIGAALDEQGIGLSQSQLSAVTEYVINDMEGVESVTDADIAGFMAEYYNVSSGS